MPGATHDRALSHGAKLVVSQFAKIVDVFVLQHKG